MPKKPFPNIKVTHHFADGTVLDDSQVKKIVLSPKLEKDYCEYLAGVIISIQNKKQEQKKVG